MSAPASERLARMLALVPWLLQHDGVTIAECATHFGVSEEELERDLWLVILCGIPGYLPDQLIDIDFWEEGRIHVIDPLQLSQPLTLSHEEALTLVVALRLLAQVPGALERDAINSAMVKIESALDVPDAHDAVAMEDRSDPDVMEVLSSNPDAVRIRYASGTDDIVSERDIVPGEVFAVDGLVYLDAFCHSAGARRTFRVDRILAAVPIPVPADVADLPTPAASGPGLGVPLTSVLLQATGRSRWVADLPGADVVSDKPFQVRLPVHSLAWAVHLVLGECGGLVALEPPALRAAVYDAARRARAAYPAV